MAQLVEPYGIAGDEFAAWLSELVAAHHDAAKQIERFGSRDDNRKHVRDLEKALFNVIRLLNPEVGPQRAGAALFAAAHGQGINWDAESKEALRLATRLAFSASLAKRQLSKADRAGAKGERQRNSLVITIGARVRELAELAGGRKLSEKAADHLTFELLKAHDILITKSTDGVVIGDTIRRIRQSVHK